MDRVYTGGAFVNGACVDGACVDRACVDKACVGRACADRACTDGPCDIIYSKNPSIPLGNGGFVYIKSPIKLEILLSLNKVKNLLMLI